MDIVGLMAQHAADAVLLAAFDQHLPARPEAACCRSQEVRDEIPSAQRRSVSWHSAASCHCSLSARNQRRIRRSRSRPRRASASRTPWGDPNLQGIWTDVYETPLQRPAKYAGREFLTEEEVAALDKQRSAILRRDHREPQGQRTGRLRRLQRRLRDGEAHRPAHVARRRSAGRPDTRLYPRRAEANGRVSRVPARADAGH